VGILYTLEPLIAEDVAQKKLRLVLEPYAPSVPGLFLYFPNRAQVSPAFRACGRRARDRPAPRGERSNRPRTVKVS